MRITLWSPSDGPPDRHRSGVKSKYDKDAGFGVVCNVRLSNTPDITIVLVGSVWTLEGFQDIKLDAKSFAVGSVELSGFSYPLQVNLEGDFRKKLFGGTVVGKQGARFTAVFLKASIEEWASFVFCVKANDALIAFPFERATIPEK